MGIVKDIESNCDDLKKSLEGLVDNLDYRFDEMLSTEKKGDKNRALTSGKAAIKETKDFIEKILN